MIYSFAFILPPNCRHRCQRSCCLVIYVNWRNYAWNGLVFVPSSLALQKSVYFSSVFFSDLFDACKFSAIEHCICAVHEYAAQTSTSNCFIAFQTHRPSSSSSFCNHKKIQWFSSASIYLFASFWLDAIINILAKIKTALSSVHKYGAQ